VSLPTPADKVAKLQTKAKAEPAFRFYTLWDKIHREDVLQEAYRRCRLNGGASGVDRETFEQIEAHGQERWLGTLQQELRTKQYTPQPLLACGFPRVMADNGRWAFLPSGTEWFKWRWCSSSGRSSRRTCCRSGVDAKMAVRRIFWHVTQHGRREVVDADLRDYFTSIPHTPLMRSLRRRIADGKVLHLIKNWMTVPVVEYVGRRRVQTTEARRTKRGTPQGSSISPLLANCYFRRFLLAWQQHGHQEQLDAYVVNYADDFVICCKRGNARAAMTRMKTLMTRLGLTVNEAKTRIACLPEESFNFLGYTFGHFYNKEGQPYLGTRPSRKAIKSLLARIHERTSSRRYADSPAEVVSDINRQLRGWSGYFDQGPVMKVYGLTRKYTERRVRRWL
jgi:RNA-directed DNA polymerase